MSSGGEKLKRWHPWRFSLRFLLLSMLCVAMFVAGWTANEFSRQPSMKVATPPLVRRRTNVQPQPVSRRWVKDIFYPSPAVDETYMREIEAERLLHEWERMEQRKRVERQFEDFPIFILPE